MWFALLAIHHRVFLFFNTDLATDIRKRQRILHSLPMLPCYKDPILPEMVSIIRSQKLLTARLARIAESTGDAGLMQLPEFQARLAFLQLTGYLDEESAVTLKGRVACEINSGDEVVGTELVFSGILNYLEPEEAVALLSALVFQEKSESEPSLPSKLEAAKEETTALAYRAGQQQQEVGVMNIVPEDFVKATLNFGLMEVVYEWAKGTPFNEICALTDVMEGSIVRTIVRLDETCREFRDAARVMGNTNLYQQMEDASLAIKRDIVFAASLYVS